MEEFTEVLEIKLPEEITIILEMTPAGISPPHYGKPKCQLRCKLKLPAHHCENLIEPLTFESELSPLWGEYLVPQWGSPEGDFRCRVKIFTGNTWLEAVEAAAVSIKPLLEAMYIRQDYWQEVHSTEGIPKGFKEAVEKTRRSIESFDL